ncbi:MAG: cobalamin-dependent protein [Deltaproteobacteria bacterium]
MTEKKEISTPLAIELPAVAKSYLEALLSANRDRANQIVREALSGGLSIRDLYLEVFQPVQHEVGHLWLLNKVSVAEEHFCTAVTQSIMSDLYLQIISSQRIGRTLVAACVGSELHEIGIRMVADFFEMEGWDTYYLGSGISAEQLIAAIVKHKPDLVALSATMTYHVTKVTELIAIIKDKFPVNTPRTMVGGLPFNASPKLWRDTGADLWASDADKAVQIANKLISEY